MKLLTQEANSYVLKDATTFFGTAEKEGPQIELVEVAAPSFERSWERDKSYEHQQHTW